VTQYRTIPERYRAEFMSGDAPWIPLIHVL
jgi:hypothetical protein